MHAGKLDFLALKWAITEQFRDYLFYAKSLVVYTDNNPLTFVLTTAKLNAIGHRCVGELADFNFTFRKDNGDADALSRMPLEPDNPDHLCTEEISPLVTTAAVQGIMLTKEAHYACVNTLQVQTSVLTETDKLLKTNCHISKQEMITAQREDEAIRRLISYKSRGH